MSEACARAVIFDLDGTLYHLGAVKLRMAMRLVGSLGILRKLSAARASVRHRRFPDGGALMDEFLRALAERSGVSESAARTWFEQRFMREFVAMLASSAKPRPGLADLLVRLREAGARLAVVSDFGHVRQRIEALGLEPGAFDELVAAQEYGVLKPDPRPVLALASKWDIEPSQVVMVGDRADLDEECARAAGMRFVGVLEGTGKSGSSYVDWTTASREIEALFGAGVIK